MISNNKEIKLEQYLIQRQALANPNQALFDFLFMTGARISEALAVTRDDINLEEKAAYIRTLKNPTTPFREVKFYPQKEQAQTLSENVLQHALTKEGKQKLWVIDRIKAWKICNKTFECTDHSFRHTNAIICAKPPVSLNAPELCARFGWSGFVSAQPYLQWNYKETINQKMGLTEKEEQK